MTFSISLTLSSTESSLSPCDFQHISYPINQSLHMKSPISLAPSISLQTPSLLYLLPHQLDTKSTIPLTPSRQQVHTSLTPSRNRVHISYPTNQSLDIESTISSSISRYIVHHISYPIHQSPHTKSTASSTSSRHIVHHISYPIHQFPHTKSTASSTPSRHKSTTVSYPINWSSDTVI